MSEAVYSPGLEGVIAGETGISTVDDGLHYRGYSVEELASHSTFEETAYLILYGELPNRADLAAFQKRLARGRACRPRSSTRCARSPRACFEHGRDAHRLQPSGALGSGHGRQQPRRQPAQGRAAAGELPSSWPRGTD